MPNPTTPPAPAASAVVFADPLLRRGLVAVVLAIATVALAAGGSFALNIAHAPAHLGARVIAALPPAALVVTFEILLVIIRRAVAARATRLTTSPDRQHRVAARGDQGTRADPAAVAGRQDRQRPGVVPLLRRPHPRGAHRRPLPHPAHRALPSAAGAHRTRLRRAGRRG
jgi:hypothetical protein